ncbi:MAG: pyridoxal phosphate-dependent aminotransferase [Hyphomicrobiaceae bacterium]
MTFAASRLAIVQPSASMAVSGRASDLKAAGHDVIDLGLGEPDFDTPAHIVEAAHAAALAGKTRYPPTGGTADLREAVVAKLQRENGLLFAGDEIIVSNGAKQVIFDALMATLEPGQEVLLCAPHFDTYKTMTSVIGGVPKVIDCSGHDEFRLTPEKLEKAISKSTRWLLLNVPSNPAGACYTADELAALGEVLEKHSDVLILSDEIYEHIIFDDRKFVSFLEACPNLRGRTLIVNGVSKAYAMTGWRIGYGAAPKALITEMTKVQSQITSGACSIAQAAATVALNGPQDHIAEFRQAFERRRNIVVDGIAGVPALTLDPPGGTFYTFIGCANAIGSKTLDGSTIQDDVAFAQYLLDDGHVAAVPGSAYSLSPFFRLSTATSDENLVEAMKRIASSVSKLTLRDGVNT